MRIQKAILGSLVSLACLFLTSCTGFLPPLISWARFSSPVKESFTVDMNGAVVYGRFTKGSDFAFGNELALRLRNEDSKREHLIRLQGTNSVYGVAVEPGRYRVTGFVATFIDRRTAGGRSFGATPIFQVQPNSATYIGDFTGYAKIVALAQEWGVRGLTNNFAVTTREFRQRYPNLATAPVRSAFGSDLLAE
jgi:hypothetical protein